MKHLALAAVLLATPAMAVGHIPSQIQMPQLTPKDAREILSLIQGSEVKVSDLPEVYRLETELSAIANQVPVSRQVPRK